MDAHRCQATTPSDLATVLLALDATVRVRSTAGERSLGIDELYSGPGEVALRPGEIVVGVSVPAATRSLATRFEKLGLWTGDFAVASAAVAVETNRAGRVRQARVVVGGIAPVPVRLTAVERAVVGADARTLDPEGLVAASRWDADALPLPGNAWKLQAASGLIARSLRSATRAAVVDRSIRQ
jgi:CO/xanthine dehydrogenase FAD-binding subunit